MAPAWMGELGDYYDHIVVALDMGGRTRCVACDNSCDCRRLVLCRVSLTLMRSCSPRLMSLALQPHHHPATADGHAPHPCCALSRIATVAWQHRARRSSPHTYAHASSTHCLPTACAGLSSHFATHVHWPVALRRRLSRGRCRKFEQVRTRICRCHW